MKTEHFEDEALWTHGCMSCARVSMGNSIICEPILMLLSRASVIFFTGTAVYI